MVARFWLFSMISLDLEHKADGSTQVQVTPTPTPSDTDLNKGTNWAEQENGLL